jgi:Protein of unknown function (DUF1573)
MTIGFTFVAILLVVVSCNLNPGVRSTDPGLQFRDDTLQLGSISRKQSAQQKIWLYNEGGQAEQILNTAASCNCTIVQFQKQAIPPGDSTAMTIAINAAQTKNGPNIETLVVRTNSREKPLKYLTLLYTVQ